MKKILVVDAIHEDGIKYLEKNGVKVVMAKGTSLKYLLNQVINVDGIIVRGTEISKEIIEKAKKLKVIGDHGSGFDNIDVDFAIKKGILVVNIPDTPTESVAEHTIGLMLAIAKDIVLADRELREGKEKYKYDYLGSELYRKKLGIIGLGRIGLAVAKKCIAGFDMKVIGYDNYINDKRKKNIEKVGIKLVDDISILLKESDFVSLHIPLTKETKNIIGVEELNIMKSTAYLVNTARGGVVNEQALFKALKVKKISGAGLDVFVTEPPQSDNPLFNLQNICITPHIAVQTKEALIRMSTTIAIEVFKALNNKKPTYIVNPEVWKSKIN